MIIFGTRGVTYTKQASQFNCPACAAGTPYKHKRVRRFFTLYFIPVIPLDLLGEYVECQSCRGTYKLDVLSYDPSAMNMAFEAEFHRAVKRAMVMVMLADGQIDAEEIGTIRGIYEKVTGTALSQEAVHAEIAAAEADPGGIADQLAKLAESLNDSGKELVLKAAFFVAAADGQFQDEEQELIGIIGQSLGMTPAHMRGVMASLSAAG